jgi:hypothetical protein
MPPSEMTPTSVVPPPMSTTMEPDASDTGRPAPMAAAMGSSIRYTSEAPAPKADSRMARRSTWVEPQGTQMMMRGLGLNVLRVHHADELLEHLLGHGEVGDHAVLHGADGLDVAGHLAQHGLGFVADGLDGFLALGPPSWRMATTEGSSSTMPLSATKIRVLAVPGQVDGQACRWKRGVVRAG